MSSKKIKLIAIIIVLVTIFSTAFGLLAHYSNWFTNWDKFNPQNWGKKDPEEQEQQVQFAGGSVLNCLTNNGVLCVSEKIAYADYAVNGIAENADSAYTLTATIKPDIAENKRINWTARFSNINSSWASDKDLSDYLTFNKSTTESGESVIVTCLQDFGEQIIIIASADADDTKKATCSVDYRKRIKRVDCNIKLHGNPMTDIDIVADNDGVYRFDFTREEKLYKIEPIPIYSNYTIDVIYSSVVNGKCTDTFGFGKDVPLYNMYYDIFFSTELIEHNSFLSEYGKTLIDTFDKYFSNYNDKDYSWYRTFANTCFLVYGELTGQDAKHPKVAYLENCCLIAFAHKDETNPDYIKQICDYIKKIYDEYQLSMFNYSFMQSDLYITSLDDFLQNAFACNTANKGVVEYTIKYSSGDFVYNHKISLGFTSKSLQEITDIEIDNGEIIV